MKHRDRLAQDLHDTAEKLNSCQSGLKVRRGEFILTEEHTVNQTEYILQVEFSYTLTPGGRAGKQLQPAGTQVVASVLN